MIEDVRYLLEKGKLEKPNFINSIQPTILLDQTVTN